MTRLQPLVLDRPGATLVRGRRCTEFWRSTRAATAVEFGLIAAPLLMTVLFLMSIGYMIFIKQGLDFAAQKAARQIRIGAVQQAQLTQAQFVQNIVCPSLPLTVNCSNVIVNVYNVAYVPGNYYNYLSYMNFVNAQQTNLAVPTLSNTNATYCPGQGGKTPSYVYLQIVYPVSLVLAAFMQAASVSYNGQKVYLLIASSTVLNEPFVAPASPC